MSSSDMSQARAARAQAIAKRKLSVEAQAQEILDSPGVNEELKRKIAYCKREIARGRDDGLRSSLSNFIREALRQRG